MNTTRKDDIKNRKEVFTPEDIQKFYYAYKNNMGQYPVVVLFLLETGLRIGEFAALRNDNVDLENNKIHIVEARSVRFKDNDKRDRILHKSSQKWRSQVHNDVGSMQGMCIVYDGADPT